MKVNEIKRTETIEKVIRTEYVANDGTVFTNKEECEKYEKTALHEVSCRLKRIFKGTQYDINDLLCDEDSVEIFDIQTDSDLVNLKMYLELSAPNKWDRVYEDVPFSLKDVKPGHEVMIFWDWEQSTFWVYGDGSIRAYGDYFTNKINKLIENEKKEKEEKKSS